MIPAGQGLEIQYDKYEKKPRRVYKTSQEWWEKFASNGIEEWAECSYQKELLEIVKDDINLAMVVHHFVGENFSKWAYAKDIPDLGGLSPVECLNTEWGTKRLRMMLMRMH